VRLRTSIRNAGARQAELERVLGGAELPSSLLPAGAVLCVRRLKDPLPGALLKERRALRPPAEWQAALAEQVHELVLHAARPAIATNAQSAPAVLFASEAELLACLAVSSVDGRLRTEWWWTGLLGNELEQPWPCWWRQAPECLPLVMAHLADLGELSHVLGHLSGNEADDLSLEMATRFALRELVRQWPSLEKPDVQANVAPSPGRRMPQAERKLALSAERFPSHATRAFAELSAKAGVLSGLHRGTHSSSSEGRNLPVVSSADENDIVALVPEIHLLPDSPGIRGFVALALGLHRRSFVVSTPGFTDIFLRWQRQVRWGDPASTAARLRSIEQPSSRPFAEPLRKHPRGPIQNPPPRQGDALGAAGVEHEALTEARSQPSGFAPSTAQPDSVFAAIERASPVGRATFQPAPASKNTGTESTAIERFATREFATDFGGLFYLINVALALDLYGDFTQPLRPGIGLSPWDLLALAGIRLLSGALAQDPLWPALAELAGRSTDEPPGHNVPAPPDWPVPNALKAGPIAPPSLASWIDQFWLVVQGRLREVIPTVRAESLLEWLFLQRARVGIAPTQVHVFYDLARHPIEIRWAGLDRDPGWVPAAGRGLYFHYD
jgi:hypothetical protein